MLYTCYWDLINRKAFLEISYATKRKVYKDKHQILEFPELTLYRMKTLEGKKHIDERGWGIAEVIDCYTFGYTHEFLRKDMKVRKMRLMVGVDITSLQHMVKDVHIEMKLYEQQIDLSKSSTLSWEKVKCATDFKVLMSPWTDYSAKPNSAGLALFQGNARACVSENMLEDCVERDEIFAKLTQRWNKV